MVMSFKFSSNSKQVNAKLSTMVARQIPFATAKSLTMTSKTLVEQNKRDITTIFSNPTAWTRNAFFSYRLRKIILEPSSSVKIEPVERHPIPFHQAALSEPTARRWTYAQSL